MGFGESDSQRVMLKDDADVTSHLNWLEQYGNDGLSTYLKGYSAELIGPVLEYLKRRHDVKTIIQEFEFECCASSPQPELPRWRAEESRTGL
ncbi:hypothetical protein RSOLAG22IIIB_03573 [Rhizoctonia solani]|uniref:Uncharacterized protein n=1 Tax=Rhizoctonia solani TaxID=456999 RepID=A0A0K6FQI8_9AGAM|nr:hypothetical protein RSOLAG22IIIB_03573 [Rhizoctonia solani]